MNRFIKGFHYSEVSAIVLMCLGLFLLVFPGAALTFVCRMIGLAILFFGIMLAGGNLSRRGSSISGIGLAIGVIVTIIGLSISARPRSIVEFIGFIVGVLLLSYGIRTLLHVKANSQVKDRKWILWLMSGVITVLLALLVLFNPFGTQKMILRLAGIVMIYAGASSMFFSTPTGDPNIIDGTATFTDVDSDRH